VSLQQKVLALALGVGNTPLHVLYDDVGHGGHERMRVNVWVDMDLGGYVGRGGGEGGYPTKVAEMQDRSHLVVPLLRLLHSPLARRRRAPRWIVVVHPRSIAANV